MPITLRNPLLSLQPITVSISLEELLADKITALAGRTHLKHRDLFDIWYLTTVFKPAPNYDLLRMKFSDYHVLTPVATLKRRLEELEPRGIAHTMERFLPANHRRAFSLNNYCDIVESNKSLIQTLVNTLDAWSDHT